MCESTALLHYMQAAGSMMRQFKRSQRLGGQILRDISLLLERDLADVAPGMLTFTHVKLTNDLQHAKIYYSFLGTQENRRLVEEYLAREKWRIRSRIGKQLRVRNIPEIEFKFDPSIEEGLRIEQLLNEINSENTQE
ncbi:MAG: 30S ribosome-binding factor RbfA [Candidatus Zixiibacteriota bacterium]|nr:MAG: 30S ribosome-binding factor RbfA [candidate division Zixibacteria bacterium]